MNKCATVLNTKFKQFINLTVNLKYVKIVYVEFVRDVIEEEEKRNENS